MGTGIKGFKSQKILKSKLKGYTEDQSVDYERYTTIQELTGDKHGADVVIHGGFEVDGVVRSVEAGSNVRVLKLTAHGAQKGDFVRFKLSGIEASILSVPDVDTVIIGSELSFNPIGLEVLICRHITPSYNVDGSLNVLASQGPVQFLKDGSVTEVSYDTDTPTDSNALPVNIVTVNGQGISTTVDLSGAQINVQLSDTGASPDSVRIGNGTNRLDINANKEALVHDADAITGLGSLLTELQLKANLNETQPVEQLGKLSTLNSFSGPLAINETWTGTGEDTLNYGNIALGIYATQASFTLGFTVEVSADNITFFPSDSFTITAGSVKFYSLCPSMRYFRLVYKNDGVASDVIIQTVLKPFHIKPSFHRLDDTLTDQNDAELVRAVISGHTTAGGGSYENVKVTPSGALVADVTVSSSALPAGAATSAKQDLLLAELQLKADLTETQPVSVQNTVPVTGTFWQATQPVSGPLTDTQLRAAAVPVSGPLTDSQLRATPVPVTGTLATTQGYADGSVYTAQISVGDITAVRATVSGSAPSATRKKLMIKPSENNSGRMFIGSSAVTISTGLEIIGPDRMEFDFNTADYYLISNTAGQVVEVLEQY